MCKGFLKSSISNNIIAQYRFQMCKGFLKNSISDNIIAFLPDPESKYKKPPGTGIKNISDNIIAFSPDPEIPYNHIDYQSHLQWSKL